MWCSSSFFKKNADLVTDLKEKNDGKTGVHFKEYPGLIIPPPFVHNKKYYKKTL
jgi:hypothetical protein